MDESSGPTSTVLLPQAFGTPNVALTRGFVTSKPSALPYPLKINIFEGSYYISGDLLSHKKC